MNPKKEVEKMKTRSEKFVSQAATRAVRDVSKMKARAEKNSRK